MRNHFRVGIRLLTTTTTKQKQVLARLGEIKSMCAAGRKVL